MCRSIKRATSPDAFASSTKLLRVYRLVNQERPDFGVATALSIFMLACIVPFLVADRWISGRRRHAIAGGRFAANKVTLGRWKYPAFGLQLGSEVEESALRMVQPRARRPHAVELPPSLNGLG